MLSPQEREMYHAITRRILDKLVNAEHDQYPELSQLLSDHRSTQQGLYREEAKNKFWESYHYMQGMSWIPNPNYKPGMKSSPRVRSFAPNGIELFLYFFEGDWMGQAAVSPAIIGKMKIVSFIEGNETSRKAFGSVLHQIIEEEKIAFSKESQR